MIYAPEAVIYHGHVFTFRTFCSQHFNYGRGTFHFHDRRIRHGSVPFRLEPKFCRSLLRYSLTHDEARPAVMLTLLFMLTQAAKAAGFVYEMVNRVRPTAQR